MLNRPMEQIKGIGPKRAEKLQKLGVCSAGDMLRMMPRGYLDYSSLNTVSQIHHLQHACLLLRLNSDPKSYRINGKSIVSVAASDETGAVTLKWFNQPYRRQQLHAGDVVYVAGCVSEKKGKSVINPSIGQSLPGILPVYASVQGLPQHVIRETMRLTLLACRDEICETLPSELMAGHELCALNVALQQVHFPSNERLLKIAQRRIAFESLLYYLINVEKQKADRARSVGIAFDTEGVLQKYLQKLPFAPTGAQRRVMEEIGTDMRQPTPMNRLLQGDVGCGKTAVALYALCVASANGYQGAFLAPTEILAEQHFLQVRAIFGDAAVLLTGSMPRVLRQSALQKLADGTAMCAVGTHALLQEDVRFCNLGLVVTDEQHRFGVRQRALLQEKGVRPDVLVMSATPIPRTLSLLMYGDLDVSIIDELPPGRVSVKTSIIPAHRRDDMYDYAVKQAMLGKQTYVVCPHIEDDEESDTPSVERVYAYLRKRFPDAPVAMLHGRMREQQKQAAIQAFRAGETGILISTTVIEVGVHVEKASIMIIEGADRFGLSQLHQLRGRVGRGNAQAYCFLLPQKDESRVSERLTVMTETNDGFEIAQRDLLLRGPGDFWGTRQHGQSDAALMAAAADMKLFEEVRQAAEEVLSVPNAQNNALLLDAEQQYANAFDHIAMN